MLGSKHRALGSATIELGDTIAVFFAPILNLVFEQNAYNVLITIFILFTAATVLQKSVEKKMLQHP